MKIKTVVITERLNIRQFKENDCADLYEYLSDKQTYKYEPGKQITIEKAKELCIERSRNKAFFAVELKVVTPYFPFRNLPRFKTHFRFPYLRPEFFFLTLKALRQAPLSLRLSV
ncbi:GNAT family N-acetyltransferase [Treponema sp. R80B11-R83G3]